MDVTLSDGTKVILKDVWTHATQKAFDTAFFAEQDKATATGRHAACPASLEAAPTIRSPWRMSRLRPAKRMWTTAKELATARGFVGIDSGGSP